MHVQSWHSVSYPGSISRTLAVSLSLNTGNAWQMANGNVPGHSNLSITFTLLFALNSLIIVVVIIIIFIIVIIFIIFNRLHVKQFDPRQQNSMSCVYVSQVCRLRICFGVLHNTRRVPGSSNNGISFSLPKSTTILHYAMTWRASSNFCCGPI